MRRVIERAVGWVRSRGEALGDAGRGRWRDVRERRPWLDHLARAFERYQERRGDRLAAALTCYGFLSFFPLLALAYSLLGYVVGISEQARDYFVRAVDSLLPGMSDQLQVEQIAQSKTAVGLLGVGALLITGLGWVQVLRESLRDIWANEPNGGGGFVSKRLWDAAVLVFLGVILICGMAVSSVATASTHMLLGWVGLDDVPGAGTGFRLLSVGCGIALNTVIFLVLFTRLSGTQASWRSIGRGALVGALGFEVLKQIATLLVGHTTGNPVYASFAVLVGLMVWINIASRYVLFTAAWTATRRVVLSADEDSPERADDSCAPAVVAAPKPRQDQNASSAY